MANAAKIHDLDTLKEQIGTLSTTAPVFGQLAYYIDQNIYNIVFMTANELAVEVGVSQGSVSRFCSALGFRGYSDFQYHLRMFVKNKSTVTLENDYLSNLDNIDEIIKSEQNNLDELKKVFSDNAYQAMLEQLSAAHRIILISSRISGTLLHYLAYNLKRIGKDVSIVEESDLMWEAIELSKDDTIAFFTVMFPQYSHSLIFKLERLKERNIPVMGITDSSLSPLTSLVNPALCLPLTQNVPFGIYSVPMLFFSILIQDLASRADETKSFMEDLDVVEEESYVFHRFYGFHS